MQSTLPVQDGRIFCITKAIFVIILATVVAVSIVVANNASYDVKTSNGMGHRHLRNRDGGSVRFNQAADVGMNIKVDTSDTVSGGAEAPVDMNIPPPPAPPKEVDERQARQETNRFYSAADNDSLGDEHQGNKLIAKEVVEDARQFPGVIGGSSRHHKVNIFNKHRRNAGQQGRRPMLSYDQNGEMDGGKELQPSSDFASMEIRRAPEPSPMRHVPGTYDEFDGHTGMYLRSSKSKSNLPVSINLHGTKEGILRDAAAAAAKW